MKKFLLFALCAIASISAFAEPYSKAKSSSIKAWSKLGIYCYQAQISAQSDAVHLIGMIHHARTIKGASLSKEQIDGYINKFKDVKTIQKKKLNLTVLLYGNNDLAEQAIEIIKQNKIKYAFGQTAVFNALVRKNDKVKAWELGKYILIKDGQGVAEINIAQQILNKMFRYKPVSVTKEQQIEFLKQLSEIYPIPGTDFNKWKAFMGFVGFKYKQLTGKDLF